MTHPATTTHASLDDDELVNAGISAGTLRVSVGLEATADLVREFVAAAAAAAMVVAARA